MYFFIIGFIIGFFIIFISFIIQRIIKVNKIFNEYYEFVVSLKQTYLYNKNLRHLKIPNYEEFFDFLIPKKDLIFKIKYWKRKDFVGFLKNPKAAIAYFNALRMNSLNEFLKEIDGELEV